MRFLEAATWVGAVIGAAFLFLAFTVEGAPQEAAAAAMAVAFAVIPYSVTAMEQRRAILRKLSDRS